jgi:hypothetical protein
VPDEAIADLRRAYKRADLTLYLGAGVSMASGLPSWDKLVLTMYLHALGRLDKEDSPLRNWRVYPNYLEAIAQFRIGSSADPAEITAQKIRALVPEPKDFVELLRGTLYDRMRYSDSGQNETLDAVRKMCSDSQSGRGLAAVVSYNYDGLVERHGSTTRAIWVDEAGNGVADDDSTRSASFELPVYHVHGYLPDEGGGSTYEHLIFTEEQFHSAASDPYSWSNLVQMRQLGASTGLMVGMSLVDRNLRRLLEAMRKVPNARPQYVILKREKAPQLDPRQLSRIEELAAEFGSNRKIDQPNAKSEDQVQAIYSLLYEHDRVMTMKVLKNLGVTVMWIDKHGELPGLLRDIAG